MMEHQDGEDPALAPMLRSTTPASKANAEHVARRSGTAMEVLTIFRLLPVRKLVPIQKRPIRTINTSVIEMLPMGLFRSAPIAFRFEVSLPSVLRLADRTALIAPTSTAGTRR
jgi:hypothetical protein